MENINEIALGYRKLWEKTPGSTMMNIPFPHEVDRVMGRVTSRMPMIEQCKECWRIFKTYPYAEFVVKIREHSKAVHPEVEEI